MKITTLIIKESDIKDYKVAIYTEISPEDDIPTFLSKVEETFCLEIVPGNVSLLNVMGTYIICEVSGITKEELTAIYGNKDKFSKLRESVLKSTAGVIRSKSMELSNLLYCTAEK